MNQSVKGRRERVSRHGRTLSYRLTDENKLGQHINVRLRKYFCFRGFLCVRESIASRIRWEKLGQLFGKKIYLCELGG